MEPSDKGGYLKGILNLFPDLLNADYLLGQRYWRKIFEKMSNRNLDKNDQVLVELSNSIRKKLTHGENFTATPEGLKWLAQKLLKIAKRFVKKEVDLAFEDFLKIAESETKEYYEAHPADMIPFDVSGLYDAISGLIYQNMLLLGIKPKCPRCGDKIWYHINEAKQRVECKGCGYNFTLDAQESWHYRLNSLANEAFSEHGLIPVILTLGQMMHDARSSFMFVPNSNIFEKNATKISEKPLEVDILCIKDGEFIIGETKESIGLFEKDDFKKMEKIGKLIRPDKIIFSSMGDRKEDREINKTVREGIENLQSGLAYLEIDVQWYPLHEWMFEANPP
jgi:ribosomal protein S27AE